MVDCTNYLSGIYLTLILSVFLPGACRESDMVAVLVNSVARRLLVVACVSQIIVSGVLLLPRAELVSLKPQTFPVSPFFVEIFPFVSSLDMNI